MKTSNTPLSDLIARPCRTVLAKRAEVASPARPGTLPALLLAGLRKRAEAPAAVTLSSLLVSGMCKRAQQLGEASRQQHRYAQSIANRKARLQQQAADAAAFRNRARRGYTGDDYYDNLASTKSRRESELANQDWESYLRGRKDLIQRDDIETTQRKVDAEGPIKSWGDSAVGQAIGTGLSYLPQGLFGAYESAKKGISNWREGKSFSEGQGEIWKQVANNARATGHDVANNLQLFANGAQKGMANVGRAVNHYVRPSSWRNDADSKALAWSRKNEWDNANQRYDERASRMVDNFREKTLRDTNSTLGMINAGSNYAVGHIAGELAATAGVGAVAKGVGSGISAGAQAMAGGIRGAGAVADGASTAARVMQGARNMAARGVEYMGDTAAMPFKAVGSAATMDAKARGAAAQAGRDAWQTVRNGTAPVRDMYTLLRHPRTSMQAFRATPWTHTWNGLTYAPRWAWNTAKPLGRHAFTDTGFKAWAAGDAVRGAYGGNYGDAGAAIGDMGMYGALGSMYLPFAVAKGMYSGMQAPQAGEQ